MKDIRGDFPSLHISDHGKPRIYLDGPAGTQIPTQVIDAISGYYKRSNANTHGAFVTTHETDQVMDDTRSAMAQLLGAEGGHNISLGQNMTSLNYSLARAIGRHLQEGDEILITQLDHEANRGPWLSLVAERIKVIEVNLLPSGKLDYDDMNTKISERTKLLCMGWSSNITGTVNDVHLARRLTKEVGAWLLIDAVHYAPHFKIDVQQLDCDFLLCSAYKFYGPHVGILYSRTGLLDQLPTDRLRTAGQQAPYSIETGTLNHAAMAGVKAAVDYMAGFGQGGDYTSQLISAYKNIGEHEDALGRMLYQGLSEIPELVVIGPNFDGHRAPTVSFYHSTKKSADICAALASQNIFAWDGHFYALRASEVLGLEDRGGVTRMGISAYTTATEIETTIREVHKICMSA